MKYRLRVFVALVAWPALQVPTFAQSVDMNIARATLLSKSFGGSIPTSGNPQRSAGWQMKFSMIESTQAKGSATFYDPHCGGTFPFAGNIDGDRFSLIIKYQGLCAGDWKLDLQIRDDGSRLVGTMVKEDGMVVPLDIR